MLIQFVVRPITIAHRISTLDSSFRCILIICLTMPFWRKKHTLEDQVIELKISARTLNSQYKKCEAESKKYERMVKQVLIRSVGSHAGNC